LISSVARRILIFHRQLPAIDPKSVKIRLIYNKIYALKKVETAAGALQERAIKKGFFSGVGCQNLR
jgi:hypothetical protein